LCRQRVSWVGATPTAPKKNRCQHSPIAAPSFQLLTVSPGKHRRLWGCDRSRSASGQLLATALIAVPCNPESGIHLMEGKIVVSSCGRDRRTPISRRRPALKCCFIHLTYPFGIVSDTKERKHEYCFHAFNHTFGGDIGRYLDIGGHGKEKRPERYGSHQLPLAGCGALPSKHRRCRYEKQAQGILQSLHGWRWPSAVTTNMTPPAGALTSGRARRRMIRSRRGLVETAAGDLMLTSRGQSLSPCAHGRSPRPAARGRPGPRLE
jgi:hypothetical protein